MQAGGNHGQDLDVRAWHLPYALGRADCRTRPTLVALLVLVTLPQAVELQGPKMLTKQRISRCKHSPSSAPVLPARSQARCIYSIVSFFISIPFISTEALIGIWQVAELKCPRCIQAFAIHICNGDLWEENFRLIKMPLFGWKNNRLTAWLPDIFAKRS